MSVSFQGTASKADFALTVRGYTKAFGGRVLVEGGDLDLLVGERAALVGPNGCGKTSFLKDVVAAAGSLEGGPVKVGPSMRLGYCAQEGGTFDREKTVGAEFAALGAKDADTERLLRRFGFPRGVVERVIGELSGGEQKRLEIARACHIGANFLILDEPTNHLDIEGREALEEGLAEFEGSLLVVSHDRWFLEKVTERVILIEDRAFQAYEGSFSEYWRDRGPSAAFRPGEAGRKDLADRGASVAKSGGLEGRNGPKSAPQAVSSLEARIGQAEVRKAGLEAEAAKAIAARDFSRAGRLASEAEAQKRLIDKLYAEWAEAGG
jgi:ABC-type multidrug transport system ATPase subunit